MSKIVRVFFTLVFVTLSAYSQAPSQSRCSLTGQFPSVRGMRLGITIDQLQALFPGGAKRKEIRDALEKAKAATSILPPFRDETRHRSRAVNANTAMNKDGLRHLFEPTEHLDGYL